MTKVFRDPEVSTVNEFASINRVPNSLDMFGSICESTLRVVFRQPAAQMLMQLRNKSRIHKAAAKRFVKAGEGYKRRQAGRNHGNGGFSASSMSHLNGYVRVDNRGGHVSKLKKMLG